MPSAPAIATYLFGISALAAGLFSLIDPARSPTQQHVSLACQAACAPSSRANNVAAIAMGIYYPLLAYQENRAFFIATVPVRLFSSVVFARSGAGWWEVGMVEGFGALATAVALVWEYMNEPKASQERKRL